MCDGSSVCIVTHRNLGGDCTALSRYVKIKTQEIAARKRAAIFGIFAAAGVKQAAAASKSRRRIQSECGQIRHFLTGEIRQILFA